jgi:phosphate starvation-inducible PhoH-like protein
MVVTGDPTQSDMPPGMPSGLSDAVVKLEALKAVGVVRFDKHDVVRHPLVGEIINAYEMAARPTAAGKREDSRRAPHGEVVPSDDGQRQ